MKKKKKQILIILISILIILVTSIFFSSKRQKQNNNNVIETNDVIEEYVQILEDNTKLNISTKLREKKMLKGLEISNIQLTHKNGISVLLADVVNTSTNKTDLMSVKLSLLDKNGNILEDLYGIIGPLQPQEKTQLNIGITTDYANAYNFTIEENK